MLCRGQLDECTAAAADADVHNSYHGQMFSTHLKVFPEFVILFSLRESDPLLRRIALTILFLHFLFVTFVCWFLFVVIASPT